MAYTLTETPLEVYKERRAKLVAALRSGQYKQTRSQLRKTLPEAYCCLGVACDIFRRDEEIAERFREAFDGTPLDWDGVAFLDADTQLPEDVAEYYGFRTQEGAFWIDGPAGTDFATLIDLNDSAKKSFAEIADVIEAEPRGLFIDPQ